MRHSLRTVSLSWLIVLVPILAGSPAGADGNGRVPNNDARPCNLLSCAANTLQSPIEGIILRITL
jgi:hypothetical protein